jgi:hypothetical protein
MALRGQVKEVKPRNGLAVKSEYVTGAGTIGKLLFCIQHIFSSERLQVASSCLYGFPLLTHHVNIYHIF